MSEFLFSKWIMQSLCTDGNKNGLVTNQIIKKALKINLSLVKEAIQVLTSSRNDFDEQVRKLPFPINEVCESRRE